MRSLAIALVLGVGCVGEPADSTLVSDDDDDDRATYERWEFDLEACRAEYRHAWLPLGSAWARVEPNGFLVCDVLLGGETENPNYDGSPAARCTFARQGTFVVDLGIGGPAFSDHSACVTP